MERFALLLFRHTRKTELPFAAVTRVFLARLGARTASFALAAVCAATLLAQSPTGTILGTIQDASGLAVPGARVIVSNDRMGLRVEVVSNEAGDYIAGALNPGRFEIAVERDGFKRFVRQGVSVTAFQNVRVDAVLEIGAVSQSVFVQGDAPLVDTRSSTVGTLVDDKRIVDLPLNGRNVLSFTQLIPGVTRTAVTGGADVSFSQQRINVNGGRAYSTNMQLDGGSMFYAHRGQGLNMPPPDAVQEIKVISAGVTAEYGRGTSVVSAITKSGSNEFHGSGWNYFRNDGLDARRFFDRSKAKLRYNQFGGTLGGPVLRNKLFFFGSYQGVLVKRETSATSAFPPTEAERRGDFTTSNPAPVDPNNNQPFPGRIIPISRFDPVAVKFLDKIPLPNDASGRLSALSPNPTTGDNVLGKFDYNLGQSDRLSYRFYLDYGRGTTPFPVVVSPGSNIPGYSPGPTSTEVWTNTINHNRTWNPNLLMSNRFTYTKFIYDEGNEVRQTLAELGAKGFADAGEPSPPRLPQLVVNGRFSASPGKDRQRIGPTFDFAHDWVLLRGKHEFKWGFQIQQHGYSSSNNSASSGRFVFDGTFSRNNMADFLMGRIVSFTQNTYLITKGDYRLPAFYAMDNWKVNRRLTLNLGLRWELYGPWKENSGQMAMYVPGARSTTFPTAPPGFIYQSDPEYLYKSDNFNLGPRIGFAYDVTGDGKTSVRGGYAVSYDGLTSEFLLSGNQPFSLSVEIRNPGPLSEPYRGINNPFPYKVDPKNAKYELPASIGGHLTSPYTASYVQNVSFTVQRQLGRDWMAQAGFIGNYGRKLPLQNEFNPAIYRPGATTRDTDARRRLAPAYRGVFGSSFDSNSSYNALQTMVTKRLSSGFTLVAHYTWAKAIDDACQQETLDQCRQQDPFNRLGSRGLGEFDRRHVAVFSYLYELPFFRGSHGITKQALAGWQLAGINSFQTGSPSTITTGSDVALTGVGYDRPDVIGNPILSQNRSKDEKFARWFDTSMFVRNATGQYGNAGRSIIPGPGSWNWDLSLQKTFPLRGESHRIELRADAFNILNHANLGDPQTGFNAPQSFGRITGTGGARVMQLVLRYEF